MDVLRSIHGDAHGGNAHIYQIGGYFWCDTGAVGVKVAPVLREDYGKDLPQVTSNEDFASVDCDQCKTRQSFDDGLNLGRRQLQLLARHILV